MEAADQASAGIHQAFRSFGGVEKFKDEVKPDQGQKP